MWQRIKKGASWLRNHITRSVAWDLFMVYLAIINVSLILFDLTYLYLRPFYDQHLPVVIRLYDPVKGIQPQPVTEEYLRLVDALAAESGYGTSDLMVGELLGDLRELSAEIVDDNPFERSGLERNRISMFVQMQEALVAEGVMTATNRDPLDVADTFWSLEPDPGRLNGRVQFFQARVAPLLEANFFRLYDKTGKLTDHFWLIDLPFLVIFIIEFFISWYLAVKRQTYPRWFMYPIVHWYDVLGIMPFKQMRLFRLFRVASIYLRLSRSDRTIVGDDPISRTIAYFSNIVSEEISDMVSLRILNETQDELAKGTHRAIIRSVASDHRDALARQLARQTSDLLTDVKVRERAQGFLEANLEQSVDSTDAFRFVPLPDVVLRPLVSSIGQAVFDAFADTLAVTVSSDEGQEALQEMIADAIDSLVTEITQGELEELVKEISIEVIEQVKATVSVRKWALPDQERRKFLTREVVE
jgi:hypothetical protein